MDNYGSDYEKAFFLYFLKNPSLFEKISEGFFKNADIDTLARVSKQFVKKFSDAPSKEQLKVIVKNVKAKKELDDGIIEAIFTTDIREYDQEWLKQTAEAWIKWIHFDKRIIAVVEYLKLQKVSPENVSQVIAEATRMVGEGAISLDQKLGLDFFEADDHVMRASDKITSGKTFIDRITEGGYDTKTLIVYVGEQNIGKCVTAGTLITVRNKKTGIIEEIAIKDFYERVKSFSF